MTEKEKSKDGLDVVDFAQALGADAVEVNGKRVPLGGNGKDQEEMVLRQAAAIQQRKRQEVTQRIQELLAGKVPPPNEFVAYMLTQVKNLRAEGEALNANIEQVERQLRQMHDRSRALQAAHDKYLQDIHQWDRPLNQGEPEKE